MKIKLSNWLLVTSILFVGISCSNDDGDEADVIDDPLSEILLIEKQPITMGWGKGFQTENGYLSLSMGGGEVQTFGDIEDNDESTQSLIDIVWPGDWGSQGGGITICAPNEGGAGGASYEYCTNWIRKKGTQISSMPDDFDLTAFENVKNVRQILDLDLTAYYDGWYYPGSGGNGQGKSYLIRTYEGYLALLYIQNVQGTYGDNYARVTFKLKITEDAY